MTELRITEAYKTVWKKNPVSGHEWPEQGDFLGYEVSGGLWIRARFRTLKAAQKDLEEKKALDKLLP